MGYPATKLEQLQELVDRYEVHVRSELDKLDESLQELLRIPSEALEIFEWFRDYEPVMRAAVNALLSLREQRKRRKCNLRGIQGNSCCEPHNCLAELRSHHCTCPFELRHPKYPGIPRFESGANYPGLIGPIEVVTPEERSGHLNLSTRCATTDKYNTLELVDLLWATAERFFSQSPREFELEIDEPRLLCILRDNLRASVVDGMNDRLRQYGAESSHRAQ